MSIVEYNVYRRWVDKWLPHLVYGSAATGTVDTTASPNHSPTPHTQAGASRVVTSDLTALPGVQIVRAV